MADSVNDSAPKLIVRACGTPEVVLDASPDYHLLGCVPGWSVCLQIHESVELAAYAGAIGSHPILFVWRGAAR